MKLLWMVIFAAYCLMAGNSFASGVLWGYTGSGAPDQWGNLDPAFALCGQGVNQSPINLTGFIEAELEPIDFKYSGLTTEILNNGHTIQVNHASGSSINLGGKSFELKQFHFHAPSENLIDGESFPMEAHFVHVAKDGSLAVIGVMYQTGEMNSALEMLWQQMPLKAGAKVALASQVKADKLLPENRDYYRFNGSLTTPPCTEGVLWMVMKEPVSVSRNQVEAFAHLMHHPNNRPVQQVNARPVLK